MSAGLSGFAQGLTSGIKTGYGIASDYKRGRIEEERNERDRKRFEREEAREEERDRLAAEIDRIRMERKQGTGAFADLISEDATSAQQKADASYDRAEASRLSRYGVSTPEAPAAPADATGVTPPAAPMAAPMADPAAAPAAAPATDTPSLSMSAREQSIFYDGGEGLYKNQKAADDRYYDQLADAYESFYAKTDPAKAAVVREQLLDLKDKGYERARKKVFADLFSGNPVAIAGLSKVYDVAKDGYSIDPNSGSYDPDSGTWKGVKFKGKDGEREVDLDQSALMRMYFASDPAKLAEFNFKASKEDREVKKDAAQMKYWEGTVANKAAEIRNKGEEIKVVKGAQAASRWADTQTKTLNSLGTLFGVNKSLTADKLATLPQAQRNLEMEKSSKASLAFDIWSLNADNEGMKEGISSALAKRITDDLVAGRLDKSKMTMNEDGTVSYKMGNRTVVLPPPRPRQ